MSKKLLVGTQEFEIPEMGDNADYGESLTDFFEAVSEALATVQQPNDILNTSASILNNQSTFVDISGFIFNSSEVISINSEFIIQRSTVLPATKLVESGFIQGNYNGSSWSFSVESTGNSGVEFNITSAGQLQYRTTINLVGSSYSGLITFRGRVFNS